MSFVEILKESLKDKRKEEETIGKIVTILKRNTSANDKEINKVAMIIYKELID